MDKDKIKHIPLALVLESLGYKTDHIDRRYYGMFHSPFHKDSTPSFKIDYNKNLWYDHSMGFGGDNIALVTRLTGKSTYDAIKYLYSLSGKTVAHKQYIPVKEEKEGQLQILSTTMVTNSHLLRYAASRGIPQDILIRYCREVRYRNTSGKEYYAIGFSNRKGWTIRSRYFKGSTGQGISYLPSKEKCGQCMMFEGMFDFLSFVTMHGHPKADVIVLNSTSLISQTKEILESYSTVSCYFDNDAAGTKCVNKIREYIGNGKVIDCSCTYLPHNDYNEYHCSIIEQEQKKNKTHKIAL